MTAAEIASKPVCFAPNVSFLIGTLARRTLCTALPTSAAVDTSFLNHPFPLITDRAVFCVSSDATLFWMGLHLFIYLLCLCFDNFAAKKACVITSFLVIRNDGSVREDEPSPAKTWCTRVGVIPNTVELHSYRRAKGVLAGTLGGDSDWYVNWIKQLNRSNEQAKQTNEQTKQIQKKYSRLNSQVL